MDQQLQHALKQKLSEHFPSIKNLNVQPVTGGSINETYQLRINDKKFFCKCNSAAKYPHLFINEQYGLTLIRKQGIFKVPEVISCFEDFSYQLLLMEWIKEGERTIVFWQKFAHQLAKLHQLTSNSFGFDHDNYMGSVPQQNNNQENWPTFFTHQRLEPLIKLCEGKGLLTPAHKKAFAALYKNLSNIFDVTEKPSLLHGDLWSGNFMCSQNSEPVLIDPAVYYGHRSMDLGMTTLFGGFHKTFYEAYDFHSPFPANFKEQWAVCNLYPLLIHLYLFGHNYLPQIERTLSKFC